MKKKYFFKNLSRIIYAQFYKIKKLTFISFLSRFFNLNITTAKRIIRVLGLKNNSRLKLLKKKIHVFNLRYIIRDRFYINYFLIKKKSLNKLGKLEITFKSLKYKHSLPLRGQRTRTNSRTRRIFHIV